MLRGDVLVVARGALHRGCASLATTGGGDASALREIGERFCASSMRLHLLLRGAGPFGGRQLRRLVLPCGGTMTMQREPANHGAARQLLAHGSPRT